MCRDQRKELPDEGLAQGEGCGWLFPRDLAPAAPHRRKENSDPEMQEFALL